MSLRSLWRAHRMHAKLIYRPCTSRTTSLAAAHSPTSTTPSPSTPPSHASTAPWIGLHEALRAEFLDTAAQLSYQDISPSRPGPPTDVYSNRRYAELERRLGHRFNNPELIELAFAHTSTATPSNLSLAWMGDAVLYLLASEQALSDRGIPHKRIQEMTTFRAELVSREHCCSLAKCLNLGKHMIVGNCVTSLSGSWKQSAVEDAALPAPKKQKNGKKKKPAPCAKTKGKKLKDEDHEEVSLEEEDSFEGNELPPNILAEAFEAVLGAVYIDAGLPAARGFYFRTLALNEALSEAVEDTEGAESDREDAGLAGAKM